MKDEKKELVWVTEEAAKRYNAINNQADKIKYFNEYIENIKGRSKEEFRANLDSLDEDVAIYKGLMLNVKQAFEKAKIEQLSTSYEMWEKFEKEMPGIKEKTQKMVNILNPLSEKLKEIDGFMKTIRTYEFEEMIKVIEKFAGLYGNNKNMMEFLIKNYKNN